LVLALFLPVINKEFIKCHYFDTFTQYILGKMNRKTLFLSACLMLSLSCFSQKVKYKDLFVLLNAKQYDQAEPFLKTYLKDNDDNPNAYLFMGLIYQDKASKGDVLKQSGQLGSFMDSAILFYDKANKGLTEKEISRNEEYYQAYNRRDIRTGKFGVTLSDVQFDLEKKIQGLKEKKERVKVLNEQYRLSEALYEKSHFIYMGIENAYPGTRELYLRADDKLSAQLKLLINRFDSTVLVFNQYKATSQLIGKTGYFQVLNLQPIVDFKKDGIAILADFTKDDLKIWDYKTWAQSTLDIIEKDITGLNAQWTAFDIEINKLRDQIKKDSVSKQEEIKQIATKLSSPDLKKYDKDPLPLAVFEMSLAELQYGSLLISNKPLRDSANILVRLRTVSTEIKSAKRLDSLGMQLMSRNWEEESKNYAGFIASSYGTKAVLESMVKSLKDFASRELIRKEKEEEEKMQSLKWLIDASDSIPLFIEAGKEYKFKPLTIVSEDHTSGISLKTPELKGYFYSITPARVPDIKISFPLDQTIFTKANLPLIKGLTTSDGKGQVYISVIYSESKAGDKFAATISKIYRSDGLAWSLPFRLNLPPSEVSFSQASGEITVKLSSPSGESQLVVIDKNGKQLTAQ